MDDLFRPWPLWVTIVLLCCHAGLISGEQPASQLMCAHYDPSCHNCKGEDCLSDQCNKTTELCQAVTLSQELACYVSWQNRSGELIVIGKGCWIGDKQQRCTDYCEDVEPKKRDNDVYFCCCSGSMCNQKYSYNPPTATIAVPTDDTGPEGPDLFSTVLYSLVPIVGIAIIIIVIFWMWRRHRLMALHEPLPTHEPNSRPPSPAIGTKHYSLELIRKTARGRFGAVWQASLDNQAVAVKVFPEMDMASWMMETQFYKLPQINDNEHILKFIGVETRYNPGHNPYIEYWILSEFHERGSLFDFLKGNLLTWEQLCVMMESMASGLAFLHEDIPASGSKGYKPAVAHRDFKSKNVLVKRDGRACIADFGLSFTFYPGQSIGEVHTQVGTIRYMAPEVLEGAISFNRDSFLRIDMYACALVLWEMLSRCSAVDGPIQSYQLPYEDEGGHSPGVEVMQDIVVARRLRPEIREHWMKHQGIASLIETIQECWDHEAEARLSASCVEERLSLLARERFVTPSLPDVTISLDTVTLPGTNV